MAYHLKKSHVQYKKYIFLVLWWNIQNIFYFLQKQVGQGLNKKLCDTAPISSKIWPHNCLICIGSKTAQTEPQPQCWKHLFCLAFPQLSPGYSSLAAIFHFQTLLSDYLIICACVCCLFSCLLFLQSSSFFLFCILFFLINLFIIYHSTQSGAMVFLYALCSCK